jgi:translation elongation factor EF-1alpha
MIKSNDNAIIKLIPQKPMVVEPFLNTSFRRITVRDMNHTVAFGVIKSVDKAIK